MTRPPPRSPLFPPPPLSRSPIPPYHPDTPEVRRDWAQYHDTISIMDREVADLLAQLEADGDRKSTRLNSSHLVISYAVFCLKKKKKQSNDTIACNTR